MPVPQSDTATTVVSADTNVAFRLGIEVPSVRTGHGLVKPRMRDEVDKALALARPGHYCAGFDAERTRECISLDFLVREARCVHA